MTAELTMWCLASTCWREIVNEEMVGQSRNRSSGINKWVWVNTYRYIFSGMNIHLPAILGFTRYQGFDPSPNGSLVLWVDFWTGSSPGPQISGWNPQAAERMMLGTYGDFNGQWLGLLKKVLIHPASCNLTQLEVNFSITTWLDTLSALFFVTDLP